MYQLIIVIHVLLGLGIIGLVMMQHGKGADAGATFGAGGSASVFGAQGAASFLSRTTAALAGLFFLTSLGLAVLNSHKGATQDIMSTVPANTEQNALLPPVEGAKTPAAPTIKAEKVDVTPAAVPTVTATPVTEAVKVESAKEQPAVEVKPATVTEAKEPVKAEAHEKVKAVEEKHSAEKHASEKHHEKTADANKHEKHAPASEKHHEKAKHHDDDKDKK